MGSRAHRRRGCGRQRSTKPLAAEQEPQVQLDIEKAFAEQNSQEVGEQEE